MRPATAAGRFGSRRRTRSASVHTAHQSRPATGVTQPVDAAQAEGPTKPAADEMVPAGPWVEASGVPVCDAASGVTTVTWTVSNPGDASVRVFDSLLAFGPDGVEVGPGASTTGTSTMVGPARAVTVSNAFHNVGWSQSVSPTVDVPVCVAAGTTPRRRCRRGRGWRRLVCRCVMRRVG